MTYVEMAEEVCDLLGVEPDDELFEKLTVLLERQVLGESEVDQDAWGEV